jgi:predicted DNA-binding transcriptional regulator AlpA
VATDGQPIDGSSSTAPGHGVNEPGGAAEPPVVFVGQAEIVEMLGISLNTIKSCRQRGDFPVPDVRIGRIAGWLPQTILTWAEHYVPVKRGQARPRR